MKVYISGSISDDPQYKKHFKRAETKLKKEGYLVFNPTCIPVIFNYWEFMKIDLSVLECCDKIYMLRGWQNSRGAKIELARAIELNIPVMYE